MVEAKKAFAAAEAKINDTVQKDGPRILQWLKGTCPRYVPLITFFSGVLLAGIAAHLSR